MEELPARKEEIEHAQHEGVQFNPLLAQTTPDMQFNRKGHIVVESEKTGRTTKKGVFAGGDIVTGAATVIKAAGAGRDAGMAIDKFLQDGEWWDPNAPKPEAAPAAVK